jgi:low affinity Fe/Cu permease
MLSRNVFRKVAQVSADVMGSPAAFMFAIAITLIWGMAGPYFHYSDSWQLVINTSTTVITFLMVFLIQNTQSRDTRVIQLKLDELLRAVHTARTELVQMEKLSDAELDVLHAEFSEVFERAQKKLKQLEESKEKRRASRTSS